MRRFIAVLTAVSFCMACTFSKMAQINSDPTAAKVRLSGQDKGVTPTSLKLGCSGVTSSGKEIELSKENYRTLKTTMEYKTLTSNIIWSIIFFWPAIFIWGKCPEDAYNFKLTKGVGDLGNRSTLTVAELQSPHEIYVSGERIVPGQRTAFDPGWHELSVQIKGRMVPAGEIRLEPATDHVVALGVGTK